MPLSLRGENDNQILVNIEDAFALEDWRERQKFLVNIEEAMLLNNAQGNQLLVSIEGAF